MNYQNLILTILNTLRDVIVDHMKYAYASVKYVEAEGIV